MRKNKPARFRDKWRIRWTDGHGVRQSLFFDNEKDAAFILSKELRQLEEVRRGLRGLKPKNKTFNELFDYRIANPMKRSSSDDVSIIGKHLRPYFGNLCLDDITQNDYIQFQKQPSITKLKPKTVSNILTLLCTCLNVAEDQGWIHSFPKIVKPKTESASEDYKYIKSKDGIEKFLNTAKVTNEMAYRLYMTAIFTGMRQGELCALTWTDVNLDGGLITVSKSFHGPTKGTYSRIVPIVNRLRVEMIKWQKQASSLLVFPHESSGMIPEQGKILQEQFQDVVKASELFPNNEQDLTDRKPRFVFHSMRHTFASHFMMNGGDIFMLQRILGHKDMKMTQRYSHLAPAAFDKVRSMFA
jgi:integrase